MNILKNVIIKNFKFCQIKQIIPRHRNPYLNLSSSQLLPIIEQYTRKNWIKLESINSLIYLSHAARKNGMEDELCTLIDLTVKNLDKVHQIINQCEEQVLRELEIADLLILLQEKGHKYEKNMRKLIYDYANVYSHLFSFEKQLQIYQLSLKNHEFDLIMNVSMQKIEKYMKQHTLTLRQFVAYLRIFKGQLKSYQIQSILSQYLTKSIEQDLQNLEKLTLYFICIHKQVNTKILQQLKVHPQLKIQETDTPKQVCLKLQLTKWKQREIPSIDEIGIETWDYDHLIWISQFSSRASSDFRDRLHQVLMGKKLGKYTSPQTILIYAVNSSIDQFKHRQVSGWLCRQENIGLEKEQDLCRMLKQIHQYKWQPYYQQFYRHVLKMSLGNFKWESQNIIYYLGEAQKIQDENMEYLRRYILNTYASLGTARRQIPTTSYFYKILSITNVENFYKDL